MPLRRWWILAAFVPALLPAPRAGAQGQPPLADTLLTWRSHEHTRSARVRVFAHDDEARPRTVVIDEQPDRAAEPATSDARYLAETIGRALGFDPVAATFVFRFTAASFAAGAPDGGKTLLLRAHFRRNDSGDLGAPLWRVLPREGLEDLTERALR